MHITVGIRLSIQHSAIPVDYMHTVSFNVPVYPACVAHGSML